jgi:2-polyprenyl-6-methoxyphenol hydroxylase-like FAD-dependent oxidoreductase
MAESSHPGATCRDRVIRRIFAWPARDAFEAALRRHVAAYTEIELRLNAELTTFEQAKCGVTAMLRDCNSSKDYVTPASYLIAAGGRALRTWTWWCRYFVR